MIQFLNAGAFAGFGQIHYHIPSRLTSTVTVTAADPAVFGCYDGPVWLGPKENMAVVQVVQPGGAGSAFYLDKPVELKPRIAFAVYPLESQCTVYRQTDASPVPIEDPLPAPLHTAAQPISIRRIHTFFDQPQEPGFLFPGERHAPYELVCVLEGTLHNIVGGQDYVVHAKEALIIPPECWHTQYGEENQGVHFVTATFSCGAPLPAFMELNPAPVNTAALVVLREILAAAGEESTQEVLLYAGLPFLLTVWLTRKDAPSAAAKTPDTLHNEHRILDRALEIVAERAHQRLTIADLSRKCGVSVAYLSLLFVRYLHTSPGAYILRIRLEQGCHMLRNGVGTVSQIAKDLHFSSPQHFSTAFKKQYGVTPRAYAKGQTKPLS